MGNHHGSGAPDLKQVMMDDESSSEIDVTFTTLMGDKVEPRREFNRRKCQVCTES